MGRLELDVVGTLVVVALLMLSALLVTLVDRGSSAAIFYSIVCMVSTIVWCVTVIYWSETK